MNLRHNIYVSPETKQPLKCEAEQTAGDDISVGKLVGEAGQEFPIHDGIVDLTFPRNLAGEEKEILDYYESVARIYDDVAHLSFRIQHVDEQQARREFVELLNLTSDARVLELAGGTGRDSEIIAGELGPNAQFYVQDLSRSMLLRCKSKLAGADVPIEFSVGNAAYLPFPDNYFDAVFSFGGLGVFGDVQRSLKEIARVGRVGARVVVGDESMAPWLYETEYGRILLNNNSLFKQPVPLALLPVDARSVTVRWVVGGAYYIIDFTVGKGEPEADFDLEIPGQRGGTLRTRFYGRLEGVTPETYKLAQQARKKSGKSMHRWLDEVVREASIKELEEP